MNYQQKRKDGHSISDNKRKVQKTFYNLSIIVKFELGYLILQLFYVYTYLFYVYITLFYVYIIIYIYTFICAIYNIIHSLN